MVTFYLAPHFAWAAIPSLEDNTGVIVATEVNGLSYLDLFSFQGLFDFWINI
jgi:hypothetical protein